MSKGKEFPPRQWFYKNNKGDWYWCDGDTGPVEYLSSAEHSHLLAEARREGRAEAYRHAAEKTANADNQYWEQYFREAAEGASDEEV